MNIKVVGVGLFLAVMLVLVSLRNRSNVKDGIRDDVVSGSTAKKDNNIDDIKRDPERSNSGYVKESRVTVGSLSDDIKAKLQLEWADVAAKNGFKQQDFRFLEGIIRTRSNDPSSKQTATWQDSSGACALEMEMINYVPSGPGRVTCWR